MKVRVIGNEVWLIGTWSERNNAIEWLIETHGESGPRARWRWVASGIAGNMLQSTDRLIIPCEQDLVVFLLHWQV